MLLIIFGIACLIVGFFFVNPKKIKLDESEFVLARLGTYSISFILITCGFFMPTNKYEKNGKETEQMQLVSMSESSQDAFFKVSDNTISFAYSVPATYSLSNDSSQYEISTIRTSDATFVFDNSIIKPYVAKYQRKMAKNIFTFSFYHSPKIEYIFYLPEQYGKTV